MYEMLAGRVPFTAKSILAVLRKQVDEAPPDVKSLRRGAPDALVRVVEKAMRKKREDRYASVEEMARELAEYARTPELEEMVRPPVTSAETISGLETGTPPTIPAGAPTVSRERPGFAPVFALAVGVLALVGALGVGAYYILRRPAPPRENPFALIRVGREEFPGRVVGGTLEERDGVWYVTVEDPFGDFRRYPVDGMEIDYRAAREEKK